MSLYKDTLTIFNVYIREESILVHVHVVAEQVLQAGKNNWLL